MENEKVFFLNSSGVRIAGRIYRNSSSSSEGLIFCHGLFSTKDGYKITRLTPSFVNAGLTVLTFDFSFVGESESHISGLSVLQEVDDLACAVQFFRKRGIKRIHIMGSSMGGTVSALYASRDIKSIQTLSLIATPIKLRELVLQSCSKEDVSSLPDNGVTMLDGIEIGNQFFKELFRIDVVSTIKKIKVPTLIIHGALDSVVPVDNAQILTDTLEPQKKLLIIDGADHNLCRDEDIAIIQKEVISWAQARGGRE